MLQRTEKFQWLSFAAIVFLFTSDVLVKWVIQKTDSLRYSVNENAAMSIPLDQNTLIVVSIVVIIFLSRVLYLNIRTDKKINSVCYAAILSGAVSNVLDRLLYGGVIDYITVMHPLPAFNLADILIVVGIGCVLYVHVTRIETPRAI